MFTSGLVLLLNIWGGKQLGVTFEQSKQLEAVHNCINVLSMFEHRWVLSISVYKQYDSIIAGGMQQDDFGNSVFIVCSAVV
jgi:hypothetical protein